MIAWIRNQSASSGHLSAGPLGSFGGSSNLSGNIMVETDPT